MTKLRTLMLAAVAAAGIMAISGNTVRPDEYLVTFGDGQPKYATPMPPGHPGACRIAAEQTMRHMRSTFGSAMFDADINMQCLDHMPPGARLIQLPPQ